jgi:hypothetical protein
MLQAGRGRDPDHLIAISDFWWTVLALTPLVGTVLLAFYEHAG